MKKLNPVAAAQATMPAKHPGAAGPSSPGPEKKANMVAAFAGKPNADSNPLTAAKKVLC